MRTNEERASERIVSARVPAAVLAELRRLAAEEDRSISSVVRRAVLDALTKRREQSEA